MQGSIFLLLAVGLLLCPPGHSQGPEKAFCDDKDVEAGVDLALLTHNAKLQEGNQMALYQIVGASKAENDSTILFNLEFLVRESDCPVGGDKVWRDCDYLPLGKTAPSPCTAVVSRGNQEENLEVISLECKRTVESTIVPSEANCLGCQEEIDVENEDLKEPVSYSLAKFNAEDGSSHHFLLLAIVSATRQVVAGFRYDIQFNLEKSNCSKEDFKELTVECHPTAESYATCNSTVYVAPWRREEPEAHVNCVHGLLRSRLGRRPAGWSPLRHYVARKRSSGPEESSEESHEATTPAPQVSTMAPSTPQTTQDLALLLPLPPDSEVPRPFHCPTKPWKQFVPLTPPPPPPPPPQNKPTPAPELKLEDGLFSDLDLLG